MQLFIVMSVFLAIFLSAFYVHYVSGTWGRLSSCCKTLSAKDCDILGRSHLLVVDRFQFNALFLVYFGSDSFFLRRTFSRGPFLKIPYAKLVSLNKSFHVRFRLFSLDGENVEIGLDKMILARLERRHGVSVA